MLDAYLAADPYSRVACETLVTTNRVVFAGETRGPATVTPDLLTHLARMAIHDIGYDQAGFSWKKARDRTAICTRSPPTSRRAWTPPATRTRAPATRA